jgi:hypothetical protein
LHEVEVVDSSPRDAAKRAIDELFRKVEGWQTVEVTMTQ